MADRRFQAFAEVIREERKLIISRTDRPGIKKGRGQMVAEGLIDFIKVLASG